MAKQKKDNRGGARPGAGRPAMGKVRITATVSEDLAALLEKEVNKSAVVDEALRKHYAQLCESAVS